MRKGILASFCLLLWAFHGHASEIHYTSNTHQAYLGDINGDGINDLLLQGNSAIYPSQWVAGTLDSHGITRHYSHNTYAIYAPLHQYHLTLGDINADGYTDIITAEGIFFADAYGFGGITAKQLNLPADNQNYLLKSGDFNGDGKADLLVLNRSGKDHFLFQSRLGEGPVVNEHLVLVQTLNHLQWAKADSNGSRTGLAERIHILDINGDGQDDVFARAYKENKKHYIAYTNEQGLFEQQNTKQLKAQLTGVDWHANRYNVHFVHRDKGELPQAMRMNNYVGGIDEQGSVTPISLDPVNHLITLDNQQAELFQQNHAVLRQTTISTATLSTPTRYPDVYFNGSPNSYIPYYQQFDVKATAVAGADFYQLYEAIGDDFNYQWKQTVSAVSDTTDPVFTNIYAGSQYGYKYYRYAACQYGIDEDICTELSPWRRIVVYTSPSTPAWVTTSKTTVVTNETYQVVFAPANGAVDGTQYFIYETNPMGDERHIQTITRAHWSDTQYVSNLIQQTIAGTYQYRVFACNPQTSCSGSFGTSIVVTGDNDPPIAYDDTAITNQGTSVTFDVLNNDKDPNGDALIVTHASASKGAVMVNHDHTLSFNSSGTGDEVSIITYTVADQKGGTDTGQVTVTILRSNANPNTPAPITMADIPQTQDNASAAIGLTKAHFRVDESGAATFSLPVAMPSGIAGVTPALSFNYHSSAPNGIMGIGWGLGGSSAITRCRQTLEQDGRFRAIDLTTATPTDPEQGDRYCYNGQRLIAVEGLYGANGTIYKTEIDSQVQVTSHGSDISGPDWFTVKKADGSVSYYGNKDADSSAYVAVSQGAIISWLVYQRFDSILHQDNKITYIYSTFGENEVLLSEIQYSGNKVVLTYNSAGQRPDKGFAYVSGNKIEQTARLDKVTVYNHLNWQTPINSYHFNYTKSGYLLNDQTQLASIEQCNGSNESGGVCLSATTFDWKNELPISQGSGYTDLNFGTLVNVIPVDHQGDGIGDFLYLYSNELAGVKQYSAHILQGNGRGDFNAPSDFARIDFTHDDSYSAPIISVIDLQGDGISELAVKTQVNGVSQWHLYQLNPYHTAYEQTLLATGIEEIKFADLNGDGLVDMLYRDTINGVWANYVRFNTRADAGFADELQAQMIAFPDIDPSNTTATLMGDKVADVNGDGLADVIAYVVHRDTYPWNITENGQTYNCTRTDSTHTTRVYTTAITSAGVLSLDFYANLPNTLITTSTIGPAPCRQDDTNIRYINPIYLADINNDGKTDILFKPTVNPQYSVVYSTGVGFSATQVLAGISSEENQDIRHINFVDIDYDGDLDLVYSSASCNLTFSDFCQHQNISGVLAEQSHAPGVSLDEYTVPMWLDVNVDGQSELVLINTADEIISVNNYTQNHYSRIKTITDGFGIATDITYKPLTDARVYSKGNDAYTIHDYGNGAPVFDFLSANYVVSDIHSIAPSYQLSVNDDFISTPNATLNIRYFYHGLKVQAGGRGSLGFAQIRSYDAQSDVTTQTDYRQDYPYIGHAMRTIQCIGDGDCQWSNHKLSDTSNLFNDHLNAQQANAPFSLHAGKVFTPYVYQNSATSYALNSDGSTERIGQTITTTHKRPVNSDQANAYVEINQLTVETFDENHLSVSKKVTDNQYSDDTQTITTHGNSRWWINRLSQSTTTHSNANSTITRTSAFTYSQTTGLLIEEITEPYRSDVQLYSKKVYQHDNWGNVIQSTLCSYHYKDSCGTLSAVDTSNAPFNVYRQNATQYTHDGRYISSESNLLLGTLNTVLSRNAWGAATSARDIDGIIADSRFDSFGNLYFSRDNTGSASHIIRRLAADASTINAPAISEPYHYVTRTEPAGGIVSYLYRNALGQKVATVSQGFAPGNWIYQYTRYDKQGRVIGQSLPSHNQSATQWQISHYDIQNRPSKTVSADGNNTVLFTYNGLSTSTTSTNDSAHFDTITETKSQTSDILGQTQSVTDTAGSIYYTHDAVGNLLTTKGVDGALISISYTNGLHKTAMADPDKGHWTYQYNMLGELVSQTDPRGYITTLYRDNAGRTTKKQVTQNSSIIETLVSTYSGHRLIQEHIVGRNYKQCFGYDHLGRSNQITTILNGQGCHDSSDLTILKQKYTEKTTFDQYGRLFQQFDPSGDSQGIENIYRNGYLHKQLEARNSADPNPTVLTEIVAMDAMGNITSSKGAAGKITSRSFHPITGLVNDIYTHDGAIQHIVYQYDGVGNLRQRHNIASNVNQSFTYDQANRLTNVSGYQPQNLTYAANGNILSKSDLQNGASYNYNNTLTGVAGSHAVTHLGYLEFHYDAAGNQTYAFDNNVITRRITYNHNSQPTLIDNQNGFTTQFDYGPNNKRYRRIDSDNGQTTTTYYIGNIEVITLPSGVIETKRYVANAIQTTRNNGTGQINYLYYDNLGSIDAITNHNGQLITRLYFGAFGQQNQIAKSQWSAQAQAYAAITLSNLIDITTKGYTGHEQLERFNLIHMGGRVYDPNTARFIQADPQIQQANNSQNLNRYSYVLNNPLRYTDPSGYNFLDLAAKWMPSVMAVVVAATPGIGPLMGGALAGWVGSGFTLKGATIGALSGAIFSGIGDTFNAQEGFFTEGGLGHILSHSIAGGVMSVLRGGHFGHGFLSAGLTKATNVNEIIKGVEDGMNASRVVLAAIIGGTISQLTGGKFANGAITAAIAQAYNGNSFWNKAKILLKSQLPGMDLFECAVAGCSYSQWGKAAANAALDMTPAGRIKAGVKLVKALQTINKSAKQTVRKGMKRGPKTDPNAPHNKKIREEGNRIIDEGGTIVAGGGRAQERLIDTKGGFKNKRRPDILYEDCNGNLCAINVGKVKVDGTPIKREQQALDDLNNIANIPTTFVRYN